MTKQSADNACGSSALRELHDASPAGLWAADLDGNGQGDFIIDFGGQMGRYAYVNNSTWLPLTGLAPKQITVADLNNNGRDDLIVDLGAGIGIYLYRDDGTRVFLHLTSPSATSGKINAADVDGQ